MAMDIEDMVVGLNGIARVCDVTPQTVLRWIQAGKIPAKKLNNGTYVASAAQLATVRKGGSRGATAAD